MQVRTLKGSILVVALLATVASADSNRYVQGIMTVHGGYAPAKDKLAPELRTKLCHGLRQALAAGYAQLKDGKPSLDAVEAAVRLLEDDPEFNAGRGAVFTHEGTIELDSSIMEGKERRAGAVASVTIIKNPVTAARAVMEKTKHVLLIGHGAEVFARQQKLEIVKPSYFKTRARWNDHLEDLKKEKREHTALPFERHWGTVGAVARDKAGTIAAATSTGGMSNKKHGRVGDSPIIGAGTYADNEATGTSCTGHGEYFIRFHVASHINSLYKYKGMSLKDAALFVLTKQLNAQAGEGGCVSMDKNNNITMVENSEGMLRGYAAADGQLHAYVYDQECTE